MAVLILWRAGAASLQFRRQALFAPGLDSAEAAVHFIDVGQGSAALVQCGGEFALIDAGTETAKEELVSYLDSVGVDELALVVLTHAHDDHAGALAQVLRDVPVRLLLWPSGETEEPPGACALAARQEAEARGVPAESASKGEQYAVGDGFVTVLSTGFASDDANDACTIVRFDGGGLSVLFGADAQEKQLEQLTGTHANLTAQVYAVAHHGSATGCAPDFLRRVRAQIAVISCGADNTFGHPDANTVYELEQAGAQVLRTDQLGSVAVWADGGGLHTVTQREAA